MKKINKILIATTLITSTSAAGILINNNVSKTEPTDTHQYEEDIVSSSKSKAPDNFDTHGAVEFVNANSENSQTNVIVTTSGFTEAPNIDNGLEDDLIFIIYEENETNKNKALGVTFTTITDIKSGLTDTTVFIFRGTTLENDQNYEIRVGRKNSINHKYEILTHNKQVFTFGSELQEATISQPTGIVTDVGSFGGQDGKIEISSTITRNDAYIQKIEYQVNDGSFQDVGDTNLDINFTIDNLAAGDYKITIKVTTNLGGVSEITTTETITVGQPTTDVVVGNINASSTPASYQKDDGTITMGSTLQTNDSTITGVEVTLNDLGPDATIWESISWTETSFSHTLTNLAAGTYNVNVRVTTNINSDLGLGPVEGTPVEVVVDQTPGEDAIVGKITANKKDTSYQTSNGIIRVTTAINPQDAIVEKVEVTKDGGVTWETAQSGDSGLDVDHIFTGLSEGTYNVNVRVTTDLSTTPILGTPVEVVIDQTQGEDATFGKVIAIPTDTSYQKDDGIIRVISTIVPQDAIVEKVEVTKDGGVTWETAQSGNTGLDVDHLFTKLSKGTYNVNVRVTTNLSTTPILGTPVEVVVGEEELTQIPIVDEEGSTVLEPIINEDGTITYISKSITTKLKTENDSFDPTLIDATNAKYEIVDNNGNSFEPPILANASYDELTGIFTLDGDLIISGQIVESGYSIALTGVNYNSTTVEDISIKTVEPIQIEEKDDGLSVDVIVGIVIGSLVGAGLLGASGWWAGSYWMNKNKTNNDEETKPKAETKPKPEIESKK